MVEMKNKEILAKEYRKTTPNQMYGDELGFIAGYEKGFTDGQPKWISVETPPDDERNVIIKTFDYRRPKENVTDTTLGYFENGYWFYDSGGHVNDGNGWMIIEWMEIPN